MSKNHFEKGKVNTPEEAQKIVENFIFEKSSFFGEHVVGVPIEKKKKYIFPLCNGRTGLLDFWAMVFKSDRHLLVRKV